MKKTITLSELRENIATDYKAQGEGIITDIAPPVAIRDLKTYSRQISNALQPAIPHLLGNIEKELNKYGFSLGSLDTTEEFGETGKEDFIVVSFPSGDELKNLFLTLQWKLVSPDSYEFRSEKLEYSVKMTVSEIAPEDYDDMINTGTVDVVGDDATTGNDVFGDDDEDLVKEEANGPASEENDLEARAMYKKVKGRQKGINKAADKLTKEESTNEELDESVIYKVRQRTFEANSGNGPKLDVQRKSAGLEFVIEGQTFVVKKSDQNAFIVKLTDFLIGDSE